MNQDDQRSASSLTSIPDVVYHVADGIPLLLDILHPDPVSPTPMPVVIFIMGGGWMKKNRKFNFTPFLAQAGFFTVSIDHRTSQEAIFPAQFEDAKAAVRWVRFHATHYHLNPERIGVWGISSGGHLAALLGTSADIPELEGRQGDNEAPGSSTRLYAVVTISAPTDFLQLGHDRPDSAEALLIGGSLHAKQDLVRMANPITYVRPNPPPFLIIHGEEDDVVPIGQSQLLYQALQQVGGDVTFVPLPGEGHMLGDIYDTQVEPMIRNFFIKHLKF